MSRRGRKWEILRSAEAAGTLQLGDAPQCPQCGKRFSCTDHLWVYGKWWNSVKPVVDEVIRRARFRLR